MKKVSSIIISILAVFAIGFTACSSDDNNNDTPNGTEEVVPGNNHKVLIAYFSEPLPDGVDASTSASRLVINDNVVGSVEYLAQIDSAEHGWRHGTHTDRYSLSWQFR